MKAQHNFNVLWVVNGVIREVVAYNKPYGVARAIKSKVENSTHRIGDVLVKSTAHKTQGRIGIGKQVGR